MSWGLIKHDMKNYIKFHSVCAPESGFKRVSGDLHGCECEGVNVFAARAGAPGKTAESGMGD